MEKIKINLQLFAQGAGDVVNTTAGHVNAYNGTANATGALNPTIKTFYDTELLENARIEMLYGQFAKKQPLPRGNGRTIEWRKWNTFAKATELQEGVIPSGQTFGMTSITDSIKQYGTYAAVSDVLELHAYDPIILGATEEMGASAAETQETLIRNALLNGTNVVYCDNVTLSSGAVSQAKSCAEMEASETVLAKLTPAMVNKVATH